MPEAPELEVVKGFLTDRAVGANVESARVIKPSVLRSMAGNFEDDIPGRALEDIRRTGKFLTLALSGDRLLVVNPMLTGGFQWSGPSDRVFKRTCFALTLSNGRELRYIDDRQMGRVYYVSPDQLGEIPQYAGHGAGRARRAPLPGRVQGAAPSVSRGDQGHHHERKGYLRHRQCVRGRDPLGRRDLPVPQEAGPERRRPSTDSRLVGASDTRGSWAGQRGNGRGHSSQETRLPEGTQQGKRAVSALRHDDQPVDRQPADHELLPNVPARTAVAKVKLDVVHISFDYAAISKMHPHGKTHRRHSREGTSPRTPIRGGNPSGSTSANMAASRLVGLALRVRRT